MCMLYYSTTNFLKVKQEIEIQENRKYIIHKMFKQRLYSTIKRKKWDKKYHNYTKNKKENIIKQVKNVKFFLNQLTIVVQIAILILKKYVDTDIS